MKQRRLAAIRALVERDAIRSQEQLRQRLATRGFDVTQATLSRDIKALGLVKRAADGAYQTGGPENAPASTVLVTLGRALAEYLSSAEAVQQLVVLRTGPGQAPLLGLAIDRARLAGVVGTLAGDDTILVIARGPRQARTLVQRLHHLADPRELA
ncbi:MAG: arginine repressor [Acidobacteria bacterium]|nr:arginine repressor [Acidobacteriota bacterium]